MRIFGHKLFENKHQQQLNDPSDYSKKIGGEELRPLLASLQPSEQSSLMAAMGMWHHTVSDGYSMCDLVDTLDHMQFSRPYQSSSSGRRNIDSATAGGSTLLNLMIAETNAAKD